MKEKIQLSYRKKNAQEILQLKTYPLEQGGCLPLFSYPMLEETGIVKHCFTTRAGGVSEGIFSDMNLSFSRGDEREAVEENYKRLSSALSIPYESFIFSHQTHTTNVIRVGKEDAGMGLLRERQYKDVDGMITNEMGVTLVTFYADCVPLYFIDKRHHAIGLSHSGWRGTVGRMGRVTLEAMKSEFGTKAEEVVCAIGPSICQSCYEISQDVAEKFAQIFTPRQQREILIKKENDKYKLDLWKANEIILLEAGILKEHLAVTNICTCCNSKLLFSHRASQGKRGNLAAVLALREESKW